MSVNMAKAVYERLAYFAICAFNFTSMEESTDSSTMQILPVPFSVLVHLGMWTAMKVHSFWKRRLYNVLTALVLITIHTFVAGELLEVMLHLLQQHGISETLYLLMPTTAACYKALIFFVKKRHITCLASMLLNDHCIARDAKEKQIQERFDKINRYVTEMTKLLVYAYVILMMSTPLTGSLPCKIWLPYSIQSSRNYWLSYAHQIFALYCCGSINLAVVNIVTGFMQQACAQFAILQHRLKALPQLVEKLRCEMSRKQANQYEKAMLVRHVQHHDYIYFYTKSLISTFNSIILVQFFASATVICLSVYQLSVTSTGDVDFLRRLLYLTCMLVEFFLYCWFANEIHFQSIQFAKNLYKSDWMVLNLKSRKMMLFLINRCSKPILISSYNMVYLSLNTFVQILKLSYSAYTVLRGSSSTHN